MGFDGDQASIDLDDFPSEFRSLKAHEVEIFSAFTRMILHIYKGR